MQQPKANSTDVNWLLASFQNLLSLNWHSCIVPSYAISAMWGDYSEEEKELIFNIFRLYDVCYYLDAHSNEP